MGCAVPTRAFCDNTRPSLQSRADLLICRGRVASGSGIPSYDRRDRDEMNGRLRLGVAGAPDADARAWKSRLRDTRAMEVPRVYKRPSHPRVHPAIRPPSFHAPGCHTVPQFGVHSRKMRHGRMDDERRGMRPLSSHRRGWTPCLPWVPRTHASQSAFLVGSASLAVTRLLPWLTRECVVEHVTAAVKQSDACCLESGLFTEARYVSARPACDKLRVRHAVALRGMWFDHTMPLPNPRVPFLEQMAHRAMLVCY
ncbi:hypothetical protein BD413DRAFT_517112 [Trametes elegans]|nr:hypothetical protein BD413DRAFT_517112 [Trametes elegans]